MTKQCKIEGCGKPLKAHGLCDTHYRRLRRGTPMDQPLQPRTPGTETFKVYQLTFENGCRYIGMTGLRRMSDRLSVHKSTPASNLRDFMGQYRNCEILAEYPWGEKGKALATQHEMTAIHETVKRMGEKCLNARMRGE